jgi:hypothetical protein
MTRVTAVSVAHSINSFGPLGSRENRRSTIRYGLCSEVAIKWIGDDGLAYETHGYTRDISPGGAYVFSSVLPPAGARVRLNIRLPIFAGESDVPVVDVEGRVLRVDKAAVARERGFSMLSEKVVLCGR